MEIIGLSTSLTSTVQIGSGNVLQGSSVNIAVGLLSGTTSSALTLTLQASGLPNFPSGTTINGNAVSGGQSFTVIIPAGQQQTQLTIAIPSGGASQNQTISLVGTSANVAYTVLGGNIEILGLSASLTSTIQIGSGDVLQGSSVNIAVGLLSGTTSSAITLTLQANGSPSFPVGTTINGNAVSGSQSFTVIIPAGQQQAQLTIAIPSGGALQNQTVALAGTSANAAYTVLGGSVEIIGLSTSLTSTIQIASGSVLQGSSVNIAVGLLSGTTSSALTLTLQANGSPNFPVGTTINGNAVSGGQSFTVIIPAGQQQTQLTIAIPSGGALQNQTVALAGTSANVAYTVLGGSVEIIGLSTSLTGTVQIGSGSVLQGSSVNIAVGLLSRHRPAVR